ncbi:MAG: MATE family efflux transporter [Erysipelotrichia bacterium]|nr:MATE family efflux transporter [Erysipelotrichia bacterium]
MSTTSNLGTERIGRLLLSLSIPAITAQLVNLLYNIVDRIYIGHLADSSAALGGLSVGLPIITLIMAVTQLFGSGGAPLAAIKLGEQKPDEAEKIMTNSFVSLIVSGVILTIIVLLFAEPLLYLFGADSSTIGYGLAYIRIYACGTVFVQIAIGMNTYINTQGFAKTGMYTVLIGAALNIVLDPVFIFVFHMNVQGAALATILSQGVSAVWVLKFLFGKKSTLRIRKAYFKPDWKVLAAIMALGISPFIMSATEGLLQISFNNQMLKYGGTLAVSTMAILLSITQLITYPIQGICQGAQPIMSYNYGAHNYERVRACFRLLFKICVTASVCIAGIAILFSRNFAAIFSGDPDVQVFASWALRIYLAGLTVFGAQIACQQSFMSLGQAKRSLMMALFRKAILLIPLVFILPNILGGTAFAIEISSAVAAYCNDGARVFATLLAEPISDILAAIVTTALFLQFYRTRLSPNKTSAEAEEID